jgi:hypothetical protein
LLSVGDKRFVECLTKTLGKNGFADYFFYRVAFAGKAFAECNSLGKAPDFGSGYTVIIDKYGCKGRKLS